MKVSPSVAITSQVAPIQANIVALNYKEHYMALNNPNACDINNCKTILLNIIS